MSDAVTLTATQKRSLLCLLPLYASLRADGAGAPEAVEAPALSPEALAEMRCELRLPYDGPAALAADTWAAQAARAGRGEELLECVRPAARRAVPAVLDALMMRVVCRVDVGAVTLEALAASDNGSTGDEEDPQRAAREAFFSEYVQRCRPLRAAEVETLLLWGRDRRDADDARARHAELQQLRQLAAALAAARAPEAEARPPLALAADAAPGGPDVRFCAACDESGGELFACGRCGELRHEACGGPRQDGAPGGGDAAVCARCRRELRADSVGSSESSLRSSTSTDERASLAGYEERSENSSLSGFVVDDEEDEEGEEGGDPGRAASAHSSRSASRSASADPLSSSSAASLDSEAEPTLDSFLHTRSKKKNKRQRGSGGDDADKGRDGASQKRKKQRREAREDSRDRADRLLREAVQKMKKRK